MALSIDRSRKYAPRTPQDQVLLAIAATTLIFEGAAVSKAASGYVRELTLGEPFAGFAVSRGDNAAGAAGDAHVMLLKRGIIFEVEVAGADGDDDIGKLVYMSDDDTFTLDADDGDTEPAAHTLIGVLRSIDSDNRCSIDFAGCLTAEGRALTTAVEALAEATA